MKIVELKEYTGRIEAELTLELLLNNGFKVILQSDDMAGQHPSLGMVNGYQIMVDEDQYAEAVDFLSAKN